MSDDRRGLARWTDPDWRAEHLAWVTTRLDGLGRRPVGEPEQRARPWSTVFRIETDDGATVWSKANGPGAAHEGPLLAWLDAAGERLPLAPLAVDAERAWLITPDLGPSLRATPTPDGRPGDQDVVGWAGIVPEIGAFQRRLADAAEELVALGVPDERPERLPAILDALLADDGIWTRVDDADRSTADRTRQDLDARRPAVRALADELAATPVGPSLDHGDLHGNNIVPLGRRDAGTDAFRVLDWGDAVVAHPFATLTTTLGSIGHHLGVDPYGAAVDVVRDAYLAGWAWVASMDDLRGWATLAMDLGHIGKAAAWERALHGLEAGEMAGFHGATAGWLADLVRRLEARSRGASVR